MDIFGNNQNEIINNNGHQAWHRVTVRDFGDKNKKYQLFHTKLGQSHAKKM